MSQHDTTDAVAFARPRDFAHSHASSRRTRTAAQGCSVDGCANGTTGRKPYCIDHLDHLPYVKHLIGEVERRVSRVAGSALGPDVLDQLELHGTASVGRLAREIGVPATRLEPVVRQLERKGLVRTSRVVGARNGRVLVFVSLARGPVGASRAAG